MPAFSTIAAITGLALSATASTIGVIKGEEARGEARDLQAKQDAKQAELEKEVKDKKAIDEQQADNIRIRNLKRRQAAPTPLPGIQAASANQTGPSLVPQYTGKTLLGM